MNGIYGLLSSVSDPIPLMGVSVEADVLGRGAKVKVSQRFRNQEETALEAVYKFPLPEGAAVCGFTALIDGKTLRGHIEEREKAFEIYDDALSDGDGGYLLDEERPNIFILSVGNLNPNAEVIIEIEYVTLLDVVGRQARFLLPTTISPRYIPDGMEEDNDIPESDRIHPPYSESVSYGLSISLKIHQGGLLKSIDSPSHPVKVEHLKGDPVNVTFSAQEVAMDRDFILNMEYEKVVASRAYRYQSGQEVFFQLDLMLELDPDETNRPQDQEHQDTGKEFIFLLDCSGSMSGDSIQEAKKALEICLRGLESGSTFNLYRFGDHYDRLFLGSESYTEESLAEALAFLESTDSDLGGTEILSPITSIYSENPKNSGGRYIILLTDGEVGNEDEIFDIARKNQESTRVFSIGIGAGCNEYFIKGLARAGMGASDFIYPGERIEPKVLGLFSKITQGSLCDLKILWGGGSVEQAPLTPSVFIESPITVFARSSGKDLLTENITIRGNLNGQEKEWRIDITESHESNIPIPILWARERIKDLEETSEDKKNKGSRQRERKGNKWQEAILEISQKYNILSQSTSFIAIEKRGKEDKTTGKLALRKIPVTVTVGWHGMGSVFGFQKASRHPICAKSILGAPEVFEERVLGFTRVSRPWSGTACRISSKKDQYERHSESTESHDSRIDVILAILSIQSADGGMRLNESVSLILNIDLIQLNEICNSINIDIDVDNFLLLSTAITLKILEMGFSEQYIVFSSNLQKSKDWMSDIISKGKPKLYGKDLITWVEEFVENEVLPNLP